MGDLRNVETHDALYYPSTFHALAAIQAQLTGAAPTTVYTLNSLAAAVWQIAGDPRLARRLADAGRATYETRASEEVLGAQWRSLLERAAVRR